MVVRFGERSGVSVVMLTSCGDVKYHGGLNGDPTSHIWFAWHGLSAAGKQGPAGAILRCPKLNRGMCPKFIRGKMR